MVSKCEQHILDTIYIQYTEIKLGKRLKTTQNIISHKTTDCGFESYSSDWTLCILCGSCMEEKGGTNLLAKDMESVTHFDVTEGANSQARGSTLPLYNIV